MSDEQFVDEPPAGAAAWREVWQHDRRYRSVPPWHARVLRMLRRFLQPDNDRQRDFNLSLLQMVEDLRRDVEATRRDFIADRQAVVRDLHRADEAIAADVVKVAGLIPVGVMRNDALFAALDQKIETLAVRLRDLTNPVVMGAPSPGPSLRSGPPSPAAAGEGARRAGEGSSDFLLYRRLEDSMRGSEAEVREAVTHYADLAQSPLLDIGCGRGELLVIAREKGIEAKGFDTNERSIADLKTRGFDVALAGIPECFAGVADAAVGSIAALHVVEHLPVDLLFALFRESARVLRDGGLLMIETPNAESMLVSSSEFWRDPTHLAPRHPAALVLLAREHGFTVDDCRAVHPFPEGTRIAIRPEDSPELQRVVHAVNGRMFGPQDLRVILRRSARA
jgi:SAM-dependent methyltransferase